jgi:hypothetical protein
MLVIELSSETEYDTNNFQESLKANI